MKVLALILIGLLLLVSCGIKGPPKAPQGTKLPSMLDKFGTGKKTSPSEREKSEKK